MTMHDERITLRQILDHAREATELVQGKDEKLLDDDRVLFLAVTRLLSIVGEAATRLSQQKRAELPQIAWRKIIGLRNILNHAYDLVDNPTLWNILQNDVPQLVAELDKLDLPEEAE